jgi:hypothetical protein
MRHLQVFPYPSTFGTGNGNDIGGIFLSGLVFLITRGMEHFMRQCVGNQIMRKIMRAHNRIIPEGVRALWRLNSRINMKASIDWPLMDSWVRACSHFENACIEALYEFGPTCFG